MKKWHMEGIVTSTGRTGVKLELPEQTWKIRWERISPEKAVMEPVPMKSKQTRAGRILQFFR